MTYSLTQLRSNEALLRRAAGEVLNPPPWKHGWSVDYQNMMVGGVRQNYRCTKCDRKVQHETNDWRWMKKTDCPIPDVAEGPLEVVASRLIKTLAVPNCTGLKLWAAIETLYLWVLDDESKECVIIEDLMWFILWATPTEQIIACLIALGVEVTNE